MSAADVVSIVFTIATTIINIIEGNKEVLAEQQVRC